MPGEDFIYLTMDSLMEPSFLAGSTRKWVGLWCLCLALSGGGGVLLLELFGVFLFTTMIIRRSK